MKLSDVFGRGVYTNSAYVHVDRSDLHLEFDADGAPDAWDLFCVTSDFDPCDVWSDTEHRNALKCSDDAPQDLRDFVHQLNMALVDLDTSGQADNFTRFCLACGCDVWIDGLVVDLDA